MGACYVRRPTGIPASRGPRQYVRTVRPASTDAPSKSRPTGHFPRGLPCTLLVVACASADAVSHAPHQASAEVELASNPPAVDPGRVGLGFYSHVRPGAARNHEHAESFEPGVDAELTRVAIWVAPVKSPEPNARAPRPQTVDVVLRSATEAGDPGPEICAWRALTEFELTPTGRNGAGEGEALATPEYRLEIPVKGGCHVVAGRRYLLTVAVARIAPADHWLWQDGEHLDHITWSRPLGAADWARIDDVDSSLRVWGRLDDQS